MITHVVDPQEGAVVLVAKVVAVGELVAPVPEVDAQAVVAGEWILRTLKNKIKMSFKKNVFIADMAKLRSIFRVEIIPVLKTQN